MAHARLFKLVAEKGRLGRALRGGALRGRGFRGARLRRRLFRLPDGIARFGQKRLGRWLVASLRDHVRRLAICTLEHGLDKGRTWSALRIRKPTLPNKGRVELFFGAPSPTWRFRRLSPKRDGPNPQQGRPEKRLSKRKRGRQNDRRRATPPNVSNIQQGRLRGHLSKTVPRERGPSLGRERIVSRERGPSRLFRPSLRTV
mmetsp:Transcript_8972/g.31594  ORF Transcript_8972/g.31594 Transcript_8972/m.31594 type:complete len:201 (-) Transcript_8972:2616-3218(-)